MEWHETLQKCVASVDSACDSAGNGAGQIECVPGSICYQLHCEKNGYGACVRMADLSGYDSEKACDKFNNGGLTPVGNFSLLFYLILCSSIFLF
jgi:hypothetical protein